jgi:hypothetical protein
VATIKLSLPAISLLRLHVVHDDIRVDDAAREARLELARPAVMVPVRTFA